jgi:tetratricopeptide (TPR) repeat protein
VAALTFITVNLGVIGAYEEAIGRYEDFLRRHDGDSILWAAYGHVLKTVGRTDEGVAAYRRALALNPASGDAWWSLANLKSGVLDAADVARMTSLLESGAPAPADRINLHFALGRALEEGGEFEASFRHYEKGNGLQRAASGYDAAVTASEVAKAKALFTPAFFAARAGHGDPSPAPIFILGMPRAGSTLIEQILASHSAIEGTAELPYIPALARELAATRSVALRTPYPEVLARLDADESRALGRLYLDRAAVHRRTGRPHFIDKLPNNWLDIGFIHQILPYARIIDARRAPLACCWSNYKQHFARGQDFAYDLGDLGKYYRDYVDLLDHFDAVLPGRIYRVAHERLVADPEAEIRRLLDHLGLPYEPACLDFHRNSRAVRTASSEQVRRPISSAGLDSWRAYESWLQPLKDALGPLADTRPPAAG